MGISDRGGFSRASNGSEVSRTSKTSLLLMRRNLISTAYTVLYCSEQKPFKCSRLPLIYYIFIYLLLIWEICSNTGTRKYGQGSSLRSWFRELEYGPTAFLLKFSSSRYRGAPQLTGVLSCTACRRARHLMSLNFS